MSCDRGFEDLTKTRQISLCALLDRVRLRHEKTAELLAAMVGDESYGVGTIKKAEAARSRYESIATSIEMQFPFWRAENRGGYGPEDARTNSEILLAMRSNDSDLAVLSGCSFQDLRAWFDYGYSMPELLPVFQAEPKRRKPKKERVK